MTQAEQQTLVDEINQIGDRLAQIYQQLKGDSNLKYNWLVFPKVIGDGEIHMINAVELWRREEESKMLLRQAESSRQLELQNEVRRQEIVEQMKHFERDRIQNQINLIDHEISNLNALIQRHQGWTGGKIELELANIQRQIDVKNLEIDKLKLQLETG